MSEPLVIVFPIYQGVTQLDFTGPLQVLSRLPNALMMRLDKGRLLDPTGSLRFPPKRPDA